MGLITGKIVLFILPICDVVPCFPFAIDTVPSEIVCYIFEEPEKERGYKNR